MSEAPPPGYWLSFDPGRLNGEQSWLQTQHDLATRLKMRKAEVATGNEMARALKTVPNWPSCPTCNSRARNMLAVHGGCSDGWHLRGPNTLGRTRQLVNEARKHETPIQRTIRTIRETTIEGGSDYG